MKRLTYLSSFSEHKNASKHKAISDCTTCHNLPISRGCNTTVHWRHSYSKAGAQTSKSSVASTSRASRSWCCIAACSTAKAFWTFQTTTIFQALTAGKTISSSQHVYINLYNICLICLTCLAQLPFAFRFEAAPLAWDTLSMRNAAECCRMLQNATCLDLWSWGIRSKGPSRTLGFSLIRDIAIMKKNAFLGSRDNSS